MKIIGVDTNKDRVLYVMCGLQCSGKSTYAKNLQKQLGELDCKIISSDQIRLEHPELTDNNKVFNKVYADINYWLRQGCDVILDATNTTIKSRKHLFQNVHENCKKICIIVNTKYEDCLQRLKERNQSDYLIKVPIEVLDKYHKSFEIPFYEEGWDEIHIVNHFNLSQSSRAINEIMGRTLDFNQHNKHHTQNLFDHLMTVSHYLRAKSKNRKLINAGYHHDIGKLFTQTYKDGDDNAHYYNHENVGTYYLLTHVGYFDNVSQSIADTLNNERDTLEFLFYVNYHMYLNNALSEKSIEKRKKLFGEEKYNNLVLFHEADKYRPEVN